MFSGRSSRSLAGQVSRLLFPVLPCSNVMVSPLGVVPKKQLGRFRTIHHFSHPRGSSVNDDISTVFSTVQYTSFDEVT